MTTIGQKNNKKSIRVLPWIVGTFALTYYLTISILALTALILNRYILEWAGLSNRPEAFQIVPSWIVILIVFLLNAMVVVGIVRYLRAGKRMIFVLFGISFLVVQITIGGLDGWQKLVLEGFLISLISFLPYGKTASKNENSAKIKVDTLPTGQKK
jgi:uncharacterized membrane protein YhaH (DUF805 family)